jgi:hypothetical protein
MQIELWRKRDVNEANHGISALFLASFKKMQASELANSISYKWRFGPAPFGPVFDNLR